jgi:CCR4-NOT transcription complex subunit 9
LGVIGALVKVDDTEVVNFLLQTEIIPLCLRIMETGSELSKTVATFIVQKILLDETGLSYVCATPERFYAVNNVLSSMVTKLLATPSVRLLKHVVRCYLRLSENVRARDALRQNLPESLRDNSFASVLRSEEMTQRWLAHLQKNLSDDREPTGPVNGEGSLASLSNPGGGLPPTGPGGLGQNKSAWSAGGLV